MTDTPTLDARLLARLTPVLAAIFWVSQPAVAHQITGNRFDAPIPLELLYAAAALTVLATTIAAARIVTTTPRTRTVTLLSPRTTRLLVTTAQVLAVLVFAVALLQGLTGRQVRAENVATLLAWAVVFDGLALLSALVGSPWRAIAPWTAIYDALAALEGRDPTLTTADSEQRDTTRSGDLEPRRRLAGWPALLGFLLLVGVVENLTVIPESPAQTAVLLAVYALVMLAGLLLAGRSWLADADPIGVLLDLVARVAPTHVTRNEAGALTATLRAPWHATAEPVDSLGRVAFVVAAVYTISFDGFTSTPAFRALEFWTHDVGLPDAVGGVALYLLGFLGFLAAFALTAAAVDALGGLDDICAAARRLAPTVLPIAVAYEFAHYTAYVATDAARLLEVALGGLGVTLELAPLAGVSIQTYWGFEVLVIVLGHVVAVLAAHRATLARYGRDRARRAHLPLTLLMVCYTVLSLWIISQPVVA